MINKEALDLIKRWEGYHTRLPDGSCKAYLDKLVKPAYRSPGYPGLWTIGYGCTEGVYEGLVWSEKQATNALLTEIAKHERAVDNLTKDIKLDENQRGALVSFSYNLGPAVLARSALLKKLLKGDEKGAAEEFLKYRKAGGKVYKGLIERRKDERALFLKHTPAQVKEGSRKLRLLDRLYKVFGGLGLGGLVSWNTLHEVRQFVTDNAGLIVLGTGAGLFLVFAVTKSYFEKTAINDYNEGRYTPSGIVDEVPSE